MLLAGAQPAPEVSFLALLSALLSCSRCHLHLQHLLPLLCLSEVPMWTGACLQNGLALIFLHELLLS